MSSRLQILAATYRTLDVIDLIRNEVEGKHPPTSICIEPWDIIPWANTKLLGAPAPATLVVVWRLALAGGRYTTPRVSTTGPTQPLVIEFNDDAAYTPTENCEADNTADALSLVNGTYFDCEHGFKDVTHILRPMFAAMSTEPLAIPVTDHTFRAPKPASASCKNQITVSYWHRATDGKVSFRCVAGCTGETLCIPREDQHSESTADVSSTIASAAVVVEKVLHNETAMPKASELRRALEKAAGRVAASCESRIAGYSHQQSRCCV